MGKGKNIRKRKLKLKRYEKLKKSKLTQLNIFRIKPKRSIFKYKFYSKSRCFDAKLLNCEFSHVNFKGAIMTKCNFKNSNFNGVEFLGTNLRGSNFRNCKFKHTIFVGVNLRECNFENAVFENTIFVNTNLGNIKCLNSSTVGIRIINKYPQFEIGEKLREVIEELRENKHIAYFKILHLNSNKLNMLNIMILKEKYDEENLIAGLKYAKDNIKVDMPTISCLINFLLKNYSIYSKI